MVLQKKNNENVSKSKKMEENSVATKKKHQTKHHV
jgi:hypothetical protein